MAQGNKILLAFYGDDLTGSTDALESICRAGANAILFLETPSQDQLSKYPRLNAFGVAGKTRALSPASMEEILLPSFQKMKERGAMHVHYKNCSTFDSAPTVGSIGKAIDCGVTVFNSQIVPVLGGAPALGRYCVFGNLFACMGIGSNGKIYRLDRHPSMSKHPVTPAEESDLRLLLAKQTTKKLGLVDVLQLNKPINSWKNHLQPDEQIVLLDVLHEEQLEKIGQWMNEQCEEGRSLFSVGSSGIEMALGKYWNKKGIMTPKIEWENPGEAKPLLAVSGSCSPVTAAQIGWAKNHGFEEVVLDPVKACNEPPEEKLLKRISDLLQEQKNVIVHTGARQAQNLSSEKLGFALGAIAKHAAKTSEVKRIVVCGGDSSSYAAQVMDIEALEMIAPLIVGAPLCRIHSKNKTMEGVEVNFKGGQVGSENYFGSLWKGAIA